MQLTHKPLRTRTKKLLFQKEMQPLFKIDNDSLLMGRELIRMGWSQPTIDLYETEKELIARFDMPGIDEEDIKIEIGEDAIRVSAEKKTILEEITASYGKIERTQKGYYRIIALPEKIDPEHAIHSYKNGVLEVRMQKIEER